MKPETLVVNLNKQYKTMKKFNVSCNKDCGAGCPLTAYIENNRIIKITNNEIAPKYFTGCPRGFLFQKTLYSKDRLLKPLVQTGSRGSSNFKEISWDNAFNIIAENFKGIIKKHGTESILPFPASGACRGIVHNTSLLSKRFFSKLGRCTWPLGSYSSHAVRYTMPFVLGTMNCGVDPLTLLDSKMIILWGANPADTRFGGRFENILKELKNKNVPIIVLDPRKTKTVEKYATQWIKINPATDTAFMSAVAYILMKENYINNEFLGKYTKGFEEYRSYILGEKDNIPKTPEWAAKICGTKPEVIRNFAVQYGETKPAALIPGLSIQRTIGGEEATRAAIILQILTENIGVKGGTSGGIYWCGLPGPYIEKIFDGNINSNITFPVYEWPDAVISKSPSDIKLIYNTGSNLLNQGSDINKNIEAFSKADFIVTHDSFLTPTAKYSDVVLPTTMWPERSDVVTCTDNYLFYSEKVVEPPDSVKNDFDIFAELSKLLGFYDKFTEGKSSDEWLDSLIEKSEIKNIKSFKETGIYEGTEQERIAFKEFIKNPLNSPLQTPSGLLEISSDRYAETGFPAVPEFRNIEKNSNYPLILITPHAKYRINSSNSNIEYYNELEDDRLWINSKDAEERNIKEKDTVTIFNQRGEITASVKVTDDIQNGTVSLNQGIWAEFSNNLPSKAPNILTSSSPTLPSHGSRTHLTYVEVKNATV